MSFFAGLRFADPHLLCRPREVSRRSEPVDFFVFLVLVVKVIEIVVLVLVEVVVDVEIVDFFVEIVVEVILVVELLVVEIIVVVVVEVVEVVVVVCLLVVKIFLFITGMASRQRGASRSSQAGISIVGSSSASSISRRCHMRLVLGSRGQGASLPRGSVLLCSGSGNDLRGTPFRAKVDPRQVSYPARPGEFHADCRGRAIQVVNVTEACQGSKSMRQLILQHDTPRPRVRRVGQPGQSPRSG